MNPHLAQRAFNGRRVLVGVCGGVAAYKVADLVGQLVQAGAEVRVAMTPEATRFVAPLTFEALSGNPVASDLFGAQGQAAPSGGELHIALSEWPEAILVAPATANVIAKLAHGLADEVLSTTVLASNAPLLLAPAMHARMWASRRPSGTSPPCARGVVCGPGRRSPRIRGERHGPPGRGGRHPARLARRAAPGPRPGGAGRPRHRRRDPREPRPRALSQQPLERAHGPRHRRGGRGQGGEGDPGHNPPLDAPRG